MVEVKNTILNRDRYLSYFSEFEKSKRGTEPAWLHEIRKEAIGCFETLGFPTSKVEEWRNTNVKPLLQHEYSVAEAVTRLESSVVDGLDFPGLESYRIVFVNGFYSEELSDLSHLPNDVKVESLAKALESDPNLWEPYLARKESYENNAFAALNTAFLTDGICVHIPRNTVLEKPIHLFHITTAKEKPLITYPRTLIVAGANSQGTIIESYGGDEDGTYLANAVTEVFIGENAHIEHEKIQRDSRQAYHVSSAQINLDKNCLYRHNSIMLGGAIVRNDIVSVLNGEYIDSTLNGLYMLNGEQHVDNNTRVVHAKPHCTSWELYKGILDDRSQGIFRGRIYVAKGAQKTDAKQSNRNLLLSKEAEANARPQLEIYADDVKCTHGATTGHLDEEAVFYLQTRGIEKDKAISLLTYAFASELIQEVHVEQIQKVLEQFIYDKLSHKH